MRGLKGAGANLVLVFELLHILIILLLAGT
jgi:hypothetical protein